MMPFEPNDPASPMLLGTVFLAAVLAFCTLHELVRRRLARPRAPRPAAEAAAEAAAAPRLEPAEATPFHVALKISRLWASILLVLVGFVSLAQYGHLWPRAFLAEHGRESPLRWVNAAILGHFVADLAWLAWGRWRYHSRPRTDLVVHHLVGAAAVGTAFAFDFGYAIIAVAMTTEMMPVATGWIAWARSRGRRDLERRGYQASLAVSVLWRLPLWLLVLVLVAHNAFGVTEPRMRLLYALCIPIAGALVVLDLVWIRHFLATLRGFASEPKVRPARARVDRSR